MSHEGIGIMDLVALFCTLMLIKLARWIAARLVQQE